MALRALVLCLGSSSESIKIFFSLKATGLVYPSTAAAVLSFVLATAQVLPEVWMAVVVETYHLANPSLRNPRRALLLRDRIVKRS